MIENIPALGGKTEPDKALQAKFAKHILSSSSWVQRTSTESVSALIHKAPFNSKT